MQLPERPSATDDDRQPMGRVVVVRLTRGAFFWVVVAIVVALGLAVWIGQRLSARPVSGASGGSSGQVPLRAAVQKSGASNSVWGELQYLPIVIERPGEFLVGRHSQAGETQWWFPGYTRERLAAFIGGLGGSATVQARLLDASRWRQTESGMVIVPEPQTVLELPPEVRERLYRQLASSPVNDWHCNPYMFVAGSFEDWFSETGLPPELVNLARTLCYPRGEAACISDMPLLWAAARSEADRKRLVKTLSREGTVIIRLLVKPQSDVEALAAYWGRGGRRKDVHHLLESLQRIPGGAAIDIAHLLPVFPRARIYTYPVPKLAPAAPKEDCFWTTLNFFNDRADDRFLVEAEWRRAIEADYYVIQSELKLGDVVLVINGQGQISHAATFIADDIVFTKNGAGYAEPWILMPLRQMVNYYSFAAGTQVAFLRPKGL